MEEVTTGTTVVIIVEDSASGPGVRKRDVSICLRQERIRLSREIELFHRLSTYPMSCNNESACCLTLRCFACPCAYVLVITMLVSLIDAAIGPQL